MALASLTRKLAERYVAGEDYELLSMLHSSQPCGASEHPVNKPQLAHVFDALLLGLPESSKLRAKMIARKSKLFVVFKR